MNALSRIVRDGAVAAVVPGTLYAVGGGIPASLPVSWLPEGFAGWMPVQCYVLRDGRDAVVLDSGLGAHRAAIEAGLRAVLADCTPPRALISRWEPDSMVNLPWLIRTFGVREVLSYGGIDPLDFFERFEEASALVQAETAAGPARLVPIGPGQMIYVGALRIEVLPVSLRLLLAVWFFEHTTGSLFTADSFGFLPNPAGPSPYAARPDAEMLSPLMLRRSLQTKFDWLVGAHTDALVADLEAMQARLPIQRVCPSFGGIIQGRDEVARLFRAAAGALRQLGSERPASPFAGFDWQRALGPQALADLSDPQRMPLTPSSVGAG